MIDQRPWTTVSEFKTTSYKCPLCKAVYEHLAEAEQCVSRPVTHDKLVKVGDEVLIRSGDGKGEKAKVTKTYVIQKDWGPQRYWHTVGVVADMLDERGCSRGCSRILTFDDYLIKVNRSIHKSQVLNGRDLDLS